MAHGTGAGAIRTAPGYRGAASFEADLARCAGLLRQGSRSFHAASRGLPQRVRGPAIALYAFCRVADDAVDLGADPRPALDALHARLDRIYRGVPAATPIERAFAVVVERFDIPRALPAALLEGFAWDAAQRRYRTVAQLRAYAARVAGSVGAMMSLLMQRRAPAVLARACDLGVAMQLTNIARDVGEDALAGRLYLPLDWLDEAGIDPQGFVARPAFTPALAAVVQRLLDEADRLYARADTGIGALPIGCRPGIRAARLLYAEIGREVERRGLDSVTQRAVVSGARKGALLVAALAPASATGGRFDPPLAETRFLVEAVRPALEPVAARGHAGSRAGRVVAAVEPQFGAVDDRIAGLVALFEKLARRDRLIMEKGSARRGGALATTSPAAG